MKDFKINNLRNIPINIIEGKLVDNPKALLINVHGIASHFQKVCDNEDSVEYRENLFYPNEIQIYGLEFHGHGKSDGLRCSVDNFDDLVNDLYCLVKYLRGKHGESIPIFIIAESMGGAVAIKFNIKYQFELSIQGYILMAPMCGIDDNLKPHPLLINLLIFFSWFFPQLPALDTNSKMNDVCKNKKYSFMKGINEFFYHGKVRLNTARECFNTSLWINENGKLFNSPLFLLHGLDDKVTNPSLSIQFFENVPNENKKIYLPKNTNHALLVGNDENDIHPKIVWAKILDWINSNIV